MKIALASDHAGYPLKQHLVEYLQKRGHHVFDLGVDTSEVSTDYSDAAAVVAQAVLEKSAERGIVVCGSGVGVCIAANKFSGIYASIVHDTYSAHQGVEHDRMNVICIGARIIGQALAEEIADTFIAAEADPHERFERRFEKVKDIEKQNLG